MTLKSFLSFLGPGYLVAVGYLDPGNWATDLAAGADFGYKLLFVILLSNMMAVLLQYLCIKLGVICQTDLAEACRKHLSFSTNLIFYVLCELAIMACDLAELIGTAIALNLLFQIPLSWGIAITCVDVLLILMGWSTKHARQFERIVTILVFMVGVCFAFLLYLTQPDWSLVLDGFIPTPIVLTNTNALYVAMGIIGATVMPHNLYLHSNIVKMRATRPFDVNHDDIADELISPTSRSSHDLEEQTSLLSDDSDSNVTVTMAQDPETLSLILRYTNYDSVIALTFALVMNASILIVAASAFQDQKDVSDLGSAHALLVQQLGPAAGLAFAIALLLSGQSSTITGTMAGQICMQGFLGSSFKVAPWLRRLITRSLAIVPALLVVLIKGDHAINDLLVLSQVVLSLQLPFAVWPLVIFTSSKKIMTVKFPPQESYIPRTTLLSSPPTTSANSSSNFPDFPSNKNQETEQPENHPASENLMINNNSITVDEDTFYPVCFANGNFLTFFAYFVAVIITTFNVILIVQILQEAENMLL